MIGILYESNEWSDFKLKAELEVLGHQVCMVNMTNDAPELEALSCSMLVSRIFASAQFRGNSSALEKMPKLLEQAEQHGIRLINPPRAHHFETDKQQATKRLADVGFDAPLLYACDVPDALDPNTFTYPCVIKPNCGGRSTFTTIAYSREDAVRFLSDLPSIPFLVEEFIASDTNYLIRVEIVGNQSPYVFHRSIGEDGLSSYHCGSTYTRIPSPEKRLLDEVQHATTALCIELGSFDIIMRSSKYYFIDANSVSNVSEDCNELLGIDLMKLHAVYISEQYHKHISSQETKEEGKK